MSGAKVIEGMRQAVESAKCDHDMEALPHVRHADHVVIRERCRKCKHFFNFFAHDVPTA